MGSAPRQRARREFALATLQQEVGSQGLQQAEQQAQGAEATRAGMERFLGSDAQLSGELFAGLETAPYRERFALNESVLSAAAQKNGMFDQLSRDERRGILGITSGKPQSAQIGEFYRGRVTQANSILAQAEAAAGAGNFDEAERLKREANDLIGGLRLPEGFGGELFSRTGGLTAEERAAQGLQGPQGQIVGKLVRDASDFLDPDSEATQRFKQNVSRGALEQIDRGAANATASGRRAARDFAARQGGGASAVLQQALQQRSLESAEGEAAFQKAQVIAKTDQFFESFSREFAGNAVAVASAFINNASGVRDQFTQALASIQNMAANFSANIAQMGFNNYNTYRALHFQERQADGSGGMGQAIGTLVGQLGGAAAGFFVGGPAGAAVGAKAGGALGGAVGAGASGDAAGALSGLSQGITGMASGGMPGGGGGGGGGGVPASASGLFDHLSIGGDL